MDSREKQIRKALKEIARLAGHPPSRADGVDELIVRCWEIYEQVDRLVDLSGGMDGTFITGD